MNGHPIHADDFDLYALGALRGTECREIEAHLAACPECAAKLAEARGRVGLLALSAPALSPPARARDRLLARIHESRAAKRVDSPSREFAKAGYWWSMIWGGAAVALAALSVFLWVANNRLNRQLGDLNSVVALLRSQSDEASHLHALMAAPDTVNVNLAPSTDMPSAKAVVLLNSRQRMMACVMLLPPPPAEKTYQLWLVPAQGNPISLDVFHPSANDNRVFLMGAMPEGVTAKAFAVTVEPAGGMSQPTGPKILVGPVS
ncbi:MAG: anti-sigma factor [Candidatus Acidiferrales bacterium]